MLRALRSQGFEWWVVPPNPMSIFGALQTFSG